MKLIYMYKFKDVICQPSHVNFSSAAVSVSLRSSAKKKENMNFEVTPQKPEFNCNPFHYFLVHVVQLGSEFDPPHATF